MTDEFLSALKRVLGSISSVTKLPNAIVYLFKNFGNCFAIFTRNERFTDIRSGEDTICDAAGLCLWECAVFTVINFIIGAVQTSTFPLGSNVFDHILSAVSSVIGIAVTALLVLLLVRHAERDSGAWGTTFTKVIAALAVLSGAFALIGISSAVIYMLFGVIQLIVSNLTGVLNIITGLILLINEVITVSVCALMLKGISESVGYDI